MFLPETEIKGLKSPENARMSSSGAIRTRAMRRQTFYVYVELIKPGGGSRQVHKVEKLKTITRLYGISNSPDETQIRADRARNKALEDAVEFACDHFYKLQEDGIAFRRVFISQLGDTLKAKQDPDALEYVQVNLKREKKPILSEVLLRSSTSQTLC